MSTVTAQALQKLRLEATWENRHRGCGRDMYVNNDCTYTRCLGLKLSRDSSGYASMEHFSEPELYLDPF